MDDFQQEFPKEVIQAHNDLLRLNLQLHHPQVKAWLHSNEAGPALREMLRHLPCHGTVH